MPRIVPALLAATCTAVFVACGGNKNENPPAAEPKPQPPAVVKKVAVNEVIDAGDYRVTIAGVGPAVPSWFHYGRLENGPGLYAITIRVAFTNPTKTGQYEGQTKHARISDDLGNTLKPWVRLGADGKAAKVDDSVQPGWAVEMRSDAGSLLDMTYFERPVPAAKMLTIRLSGRAYGVDEEWELTVPVKR